MSSSNSDSSSPTVSNPLVTDSLTPTSVVIPDLISHCDFPSFYHPDGDVTAADSLHWLLSFVPDFIPRQVAVMSSIKGGELMAFCYSNCTPDRLRVLCDFLNLLCHLDNISDGMLEVDAKGLGDSVMNAFEWHGNFRPLPGREGNLEEIYASRMARDFWSRCKSGCAPAVQERFKCSMEVYFTTMHQQASARTSGYICDLQSYVEMRRSSSGMRPCIDLIEYSHGFALPGEVVEHPVIMALKQDVIDVAGWANDIFSYDVEQARGDAHNLVCVLMNQEGLALQEAFDRAGDMCKRSIDTFVENTRRVPSWNADIDRDVALYVFGLQQWIIGSFHWSYKTERYFGDKGEEVKSTRVVNLRPVKKGTGWDE